MNANPSPQPSSRAPRWREHRNRVESGPHRRHDAPAARAQRASAWALVGAAALLAAACHYSNPHGDQALPPTTRLVTEPHGATVHLPRLNRTMEAPCELAEDVVSDETVIITMEGYVPYQGPLSALPEIARGTRRCVLRKE